MTLKEYLATENIPAMRFGERIGLREPNSIYRYLRGDRVPTPKVMQAIIRETRGRVSADSFFQAAE